MSKAIDRATSFAHTVEMMKKAILMLLAAGLFSAAHAQDKALLYELSGNGLSQPSYLYGTFHLVCPADLRLSAATSKAMSAAQQLYLEIDMDDPGLQARLMGSMMFSGGKALRDFMSASDYATLDNYLVQNVGVGLTQMGMLKPVALLGLLYQGVLKCEPASYDLTLSDIARRDKKEVLGLETVEEQMAMFDKIPIEQQVKGLVDVARKPEEARREVANLLAAYKAQDLPQLMKLFRETEFDSEFAQFEEELLTKRNANWIPIIEKAARGKSTLFAFGAAHLAGSGGVVNLLRQKGYTVKPAQ
jgi:uncharacterized protein YbaP (TraB family)